MSSESYSASIDSTVTRLLVYTKDLLETLTQWAHHEATEEDVSDVYVKLGNEFNQACRSFLSANIDIADLGDVPQELRVILERALAGDADEENLDRYLPQIRDIIVVLLRRLKHKQAKARQGGRVVSNSQPTRPGYPTHGHKPSDSSQRSGHSGQPQVYSGPTGGASNGAPPSVPPHGQHAQNGHTVRHSHSASAVGTGSRPAQNQVYGHPSSSTPSLPQQAMAHSHAPQFLPHSRKGSTSSSGTSGSTTSPQRAQVPGHAPPQINTQAPPPQQQPRMKSAAPILGQMPDFQVNAGVSDPMAALQRSEALERRASKRFSAYHMSKIMNSSSSESTLLPTMSAHTSFPAEYTSSSVVDESSRDRLRSISGSRHLTSVPEAPPPAIRSTSASHGRKQLSEAKAQSSAPGTPRTPSTPVAGEGRMMPTPPVDQHSKDIQGFTDATSAHTPQESISSATTEAAHDEVPTKEWSETPSTDISNTPTKINVYLRLGSRIRKGSIFLPPSLASVRLQFVDMFGYTPPANEIFPDMTIQDPTSGIDYELTEKSISDVHDGVLLTLKAKTDDELSLQAQLKEMTTKLDELIHRADHGPISGTNKSSGSPLIGHAPNSRNVANFGRNRRPSNTPATPVTSSRKLPADSVEFFREEIAVIRQATSKVIAISRQEIESLRAELKALQTSNAGTSRGFMVASQKKLKEDSAHLISCLEDLQDLVESQRKDVVARGVRLVPKQLEGVSKLLVQTQKQVNELESWIKKEKTTWNKTWESELNTIVEEQQALHHQERLVSDCQTDINNAKKTFELVEQCTAELNRSDMKRNPIAHAMPDTVNHLEIRNAMLGEVQALQPNHEQRVEAIERSERLRKRELAMRRDDFEEELGEFVGENKLKQTGGIEEVDRRRRERDEQNREEQRKIDSEAQKQKELIKEERRKQRENAKAESNADATDPSPQLNPEQNQDDSESRTGN